MVVFALISETRGRVGYPTYTVSSWYDFAMFCGGLGSARLNGRRIQRRVSERGRSQCMDSRLEVRVALVTRWELRGNVSVW